jgi:hypothetical protein
MVDFRSTIAVKPKEKGAAGDRRPLLEPADEPLTLVDY